MAVKHSVVSLPTHTTPRRMAAGPTPRSLPGISDRNHPVLTAAAVPKPTINRPKVLAPSAHAQHIAHVAHLAQVAKANAVKTSTKGAGAASKSKTTSTTLDPHQLHVLHLAHLASLGGGAGSSGGAGGSSTPSGGGGVVGPISSTTGVGGTASSVSSSLFRIVEYAAIILFLIWAWRKGYIQAALKRVGKLGQNSGDAVARIGKGSKR